MKFNSKKTIFMLIAGVALVLCVICGDFFNIHKIKESSYYSQNNIILNSIKNKTLTELINKATNNEQKGPVPMSDKIAYLTIDDGPSIYTNQILDILKENNIKATFFMVNGNMKRYEDEVKRASDEGHSVGFHSVTHEVKSLYKTPQATVDEFDTCKETFYNITGQNSSLIRLPYGSKPYMPESSHELLLQEGYKMWDWNLDTQDWRSTTDVIVSNILYYGRDNPNLVILMHEKQQTVDALESMIKILKERGYDIIPINEQTKEMNFWDKNL